jgi:hypothetical protein
MKTMSRKPTAEELLERADELLSRAYIMLDGWQRAADWHTDYTLFKLRSVTTPTEKLQPMNYTYRKRPVEIEAFQMTRARRTDNSDWPNWLHRAWNIDADEIGAVAPVNYPMSDGTDQLKIVTLEGVMRVGWDDFIIRGVKGELYACKPDIFAATYEEVSA